ncbi:MAG: VCBS repeat-containing protein, partial [Bacteroidota bacterium]
PDIYVTNDYLSNDILYINQGNGTFKDQLATAFKHTSFASMGIDVADLNNDGRSDIFIADMFPEDRIHEKMMTPGGDYNRFKYILKTGYSPQYSRNTLQANQGNNTYSDLGQMAGIHKTDWSWSPLLVDLDNDGMKDIFVSNGFLRDMGDLDYITYVGDHTFGSKEALRQRQIDKIHSLPGIKLPNYCYQNTGDFQFANKASEWGLSDSTFTQGAAYGDLDLDGDIDLIINNVNQPSIIYENRTRQIDSSAYLAIRLIPAQAHQPVSGTKVWLHSSKKTQYLEAQTGRGYASSVDPLLHFGLGNMEAVDSLVMLWPDRSRQVILFPPIDTLLNIHQSIPAQKSHIANPIGIPKTFTSITPFPFFHTEDVHSDFFQQPMLPHEFTRLGPAMATGDVDGNGLEDVFLGGAAGKESWLYFQQVGGEFTSQELAHGAQFEDIDACWLDIDQDTDLDLYVVSGGSMYGQVEQLYQDRLYLNDGEGNLHWDSTALPIMPTSGAFVRPYDWDGDGDLDLFIGGRVVPGSYPDVPRSYLLQNDGGSFSDITHSIAPKLANWGMLTDAQWVDVLGDEKPELVLVGEWLPITVFAMGEEKLEPVPIAGLEKSNGWWNCLAVGDLDRDGDMDLLAGNLGLNSNHQTSQTHPVCLYAADFDKNGSIDPVLCEWVEGKEYPVVSRDVLLRQLVGKRKKFTDYQSYAKATLDQVLTRAELEEAKTLIAYQFASSWVENKGGGEFQMHALPWQLQTAPLQDMWIEDLDQDGALDVL